MSAKPHGREIRAGQSPHDPVASDAFRDRVIRYGEAVRIDPGEPEYTDDSLYVIGAIMCACLASVGLWMLLLLAWRAWS